MSKKVLSARQFCKADVVAIDEVGVLTAEQQQDLSALYEHALGSYKQGALAQGHIMQVSSDGVLVDIGFKSSGLIPLYEFSEEEVKNLTVGAPIEVIIDELESVDGTIVLSYEKAKAARAWSTIMKLFEENKPVDGIVTHKVKGGLSVDINGVPAFLPGSQVDVQRVADFDVYLKQSITAYIIKVNQKRGNVIISRRKFLSEQRAGARKKIMDTIKVGDVIQGTVKNITNYGAFIDIGGVDGLLHITDMDWTRIAHPSEVLKIGDTVTVKVLTLDAVNEKISLGMKQLHGNPWGALGSEITIGSVIKGTVSSIADYGLFVTVTKGVEGLVHISEISWTERITDLHKHFHVGDTVEARVVSLDADNRRMSLSIKQLGKNPWDVVEESLKVGQKIRGIVSNVVDFGIFVQVAPGIDGLIHVADFSWTDHIKHPSEQFKKGDTVEAVITDINVAKKKVSLSIKQLQQNPWDTIEERYPINAIVEGEVTKVTDFGAFVRLPDGIEGLVHVSELSAHGPNEQGTTGVKVGQKVKLRVLKVSKEEQKLGLSMRLEPSSRDRQERRSEHGEHHRQERSGGDRGEHRGERGSNHGERRRDHHRSDRTGTHEQGYTGRRGSESAPLPTAFGEKLKSQLQLELERHAHRTTKTGGGSSHDEQ